MEQQKRCIIKNNQSIGKYNILKRVGSGSFGDCYSAVDTETNNVVCIKFIRNEKRNPTNCLFFHFSFFENASFLFVFRPVWLPSC